MPWRTIYEGIHYPRGRFGPSTIGLLLPDPIPGKRDSVRTLSWSIPLTFNARHGRSFKYCSSLTENKIIMRAQAFSRPAEYGADFDIERSIVDSLCDRPQN